MASLSGWARQLGPRARAVRGGLHPASALRMAAGRHGDVRLSGVALQGPDMRAVANTAVEVAAGEYARAGFEVGAGDVVIDGGANVGAFSVLAARSGGRVTAYEPAPETFAFLERNVAPLGVRCVRAALVAARPPEGTVRLAAGSASSQARVARAGEEVPALALEEAIAAGCDLLKLDVEGSEQELLTETAGEVLRRARRIVCEVHPWTDGADVLGARLRALGYSVHVERKADGLALLFARTSVA